MAPIRMSGMNSGLDTESIVKALVSGYESKKQKVEKNQTKLEWSQEIWKGVNSKVYSLYTGLDKVRFSSAYKSKKTSLSDASKATITAGTGAVNGTQKLKITKMASAGFLTGAKIKNIHDGSVAPESKLTSLGIETGSELKLSYGGKNTTITVDENMTVKDFVGKLQEGGVNASFDEGNGRFFISSKESGKGNDFDLSGVGAKGVDALTKLGLFTKSDEDIQALEKTKNYGTFFADGSLDKTATRNNLISQLNSYQQRFSDAFAARTSANNEGDAEAIARAEAQIEDIRREMGGNELFAPYADTFSTGGDAVSPEQINAIADEGISKIESAISGLKGNGSDGATRVRGQDAEIYLNGAQFTSDTNNFNINGLSINLTGVTGDDEITITTSTDVDSIYDKVKEFMGQYSDLINELQGLYNADSAKDFEPLTEDQKAEMNDTEIEKWESKIKDSLLRRDSTLGSVISTMTTAMAMGYEVTAKDGSKQTMSLNSLGIHTLGFLNAKPNEQYAYHIDGDEDDTNTGGKADKLREMIESDPDAVADLMSQVAQGLYKALDTKIGAKTSEMSSAYTLYNDKQMTKQLDQYKKDVKQWDSRIADTEDMYYKKFTAMEKALANLNSSQTALTGMIG